MRQQSALKHMHDAVSPQQAACRLIRDGGETFREAPRMAMATTDVAPRAPRTPRLPAPSHKAPRRRISSRVGRTAAGVRPERRGFVQRLRETPGRTGLTNDQNRLKTKSGSAERSSVNDFGKSTPAADADAAAREWLAERGLTLVADGILGAFQRARIGATQWADMLAGMTSVELAALVGSVKRQNALAAAVRGKQDSRTTALSADDGMNSLAARNDTSDSDSDSGAVSSSSDEGSGCSDGSCSSDDENVISTERCRCRIGHPPDSVQRASTARSIPSSPAQPNVRWCHTVGELVDLDALYHSRSPDERAADLSSRPATSQPQGMHHLESAWAQHVAKLFKLSWQLRQHKKCCGWTTSTMHDQIRQANDISQARNIFNGAMLATSTYQSTAQAKVTTACQPIDREMSADALIALAQKRACKAAWGVNTEACQLREHKIEPTNQDDVDSLWTQVASGLLAGSAQRDAEGNGMERSVVARRNAGLIALAETLQKVVVVNNGKRVGTR